MSTSNTIANVVTLPVVLAFFWWLGPLLGGLVTLMGLLYYSLAVFEMRTTQEWLAARRARKQARLLARLEAKKKIVLAKIDAIETVRSAKVEALDLVARERAEAAKIIAVQATSEAIQDAKK